MVYTGGTVLRRGRIHQELRRKGMTLIMLWEEYCAEVGERHSAEHPVKPWRYSQFCENYRRFAKGLKRSMRQNHAWLFTTSMASLAPSAWR